MLQDLSNGIGTTGMMWVPSQVVISEEHHTLGWLCRMQRVALHNRNGVSLYGKLCSGIPVRRQNMEWSQRP